jgi:hypothetical protein
MLIFLPRKTLYGLLHFEASSGQDRLSPLGSDTKIDGMGCHDSPTNFVRSVESQLLVQGLEGQCRLLYNRGKPDEAVWVA